MCTLLNILALHGKYQSAEVFRTRIGRFPNKAKQIAKFTFVDAPHFMELRPEDSTPMRTWFYRNGNVIIEESLDTTLNYLEEVWKRDGPFDGILGFSMGGSVASMLATMPERFPGVRFVLIGGAPDVPSHLLDNHGQSKIPKHVKSLHLIGLADNAVPPHVSHSLASRFSNPLVTEHEQGHCIPTRAAQLDGYVEFIRQFCESPDDLRNTKDRSSEISQPTEPPRSSEQPTNESKLNPPQQQHLAETDAICQLQNEEVEVLGSIYSPEEFSILGDLPHKASDPTVRCKVILNPSHSGNGIPANWIGNLAIHFTLQASYPSKPNQPPIVEITTGSLSLLDFSTAHRRSLQQAIRQVASEICQVEGETCLMQCIQAANDWLSDGGEILQPLRNDSQPDSAEEKSADPEATFACAIESSIMNDVDEEVESQWIKEATLEAGHAAAIAKTRGIDMASDLTPDLLSEDNIIASASARGIWNYTVGLVGKPSAGKSTFYNAVTRALLDSRGHRHIAEVAPHPFTTIEPNIGPGWYASFHDEIVDPEQIDIEPLHGWCELKRGQYSSPSLPSSNDNSSTEQTYRRMLPILVKDVAGLVPGAYKGRGKGNRFLADLCDADVLVHVVDATGQSDKDGNILHASDDSKQLSNPSEDAEWIRQELHRWIFNNVKAKWDSVFRKGTKGGMSRVLALFSGYHGPLWNVELAAKRAHLNFDVVTKWTAQDLHRLVAHYLSIRFPICLALNKVDSLREMDPSSSNVGSGSGISSRLQSIDIIYQCQQEARLRGEVAVPVSARSEFWLQQKLSQKSLPHVESNEYKAEEQRLQKCLSCWGSTGVLEAISEAVKLKPPVLVYPVLDLDSELPIGWTASMTNEIVSSNGRMPILRDCLQFKQGSTVDDVFESLKHGALSHASIQGDFIRAEGKPIRKVPLSSLAHTGKESRKHQLKRESVVDETNAILRIQTNKKSVWQQSR